ncbi:sphinganine kinase lcb4 [Yamadazyma tenuis]
MSSSSERLLLPQSGTRCRVENTGLVIIDQSLLNPAHSSSYACFPSGASGPTSRTILFEDILWCEQLHETTYAVTYATPIGTNIDTMTFTATIDDVPTAYTPTQSQDLSAHILQRAYGTSIVKPSVLVLINPHGGQGKAKSIYTHRIQPVLEAAKADITVIETLYSKHAMDVARELDIDKYDIIACCSGDGIPHEVINGFYQRPDKGAAAFNKLVVTQLPCGSGNALTLSTHGSNRAAVATFRMLKSEKTQMDLMALTQLDDDGHEQTSLSFLSQCYGAISDSDIGTEHLRWMGPIRFDLGVVQRTLSRAVYPCEVYVKYLTTTKDELVSYFNQCVGQAKETHVITKETLDIKGPKLTESPPSDWIQVDQSLTDNLSIFYVGNMPMVSSNTQFFPAALPNDGSMDMIITDARTSLPKALRALLAIEKGTHVDELFVSHHKVTSYRLVPKLPENSKHYLSVDGEDFPFRAFQVEVLPSVLTTLTSDGNYVPTSFRN